MLFKLLQEEKAYEPIDLTVLGITMLFMLLQYWKASFPIAVTLKSFPWIVTVDGIDTAVCVEGSFIQYTTHSAGSMLVAINFSEYFP